MNMTFKSSNLLSFLYLWGLLKLKAIEVLFWHEPHLSRWDEMRHQTKVEIDNCDLFCLKGGVYYAHLIIHTHLGFVWLVGVLFWHELHLSRWDETPNRSWNRQLWLILLKGWCLITHTLLYTHLRDKVKTWN